MAKVEHPLEALRQFLPEGSFDPVVQLIHQYKVHLTVTKARKSVLGDYRHPFLGANHKISVNGNLNQYEFLITLLHELAHLLCYESYKNRVEAHGQEWKSIYGNLLAQFIQMDIFKFTDFEKLANQYWSGQLNSNSGLTQKEIIFEGQIKVLSEHDNPLTV